MKKFLGKAYLVWSAFGFVSSYLVLFPFFALSAQRFEWHKYATTLNKIWANVLYRAILLPFKVEGRHRLDRKQTYVYCANHASYIDIPSMAYAVVHHIVFVGKNSLEKVPLFGYMFRKIHVPIDRANPRSSMKSLEMAEEKLARGYSVAFFPEGGIRTKNPPGMVRFKDGAFRVAIAQQVPVVPVTMPYNWIVMPIEGMIMRRHKIKVIFHEPIPTAGMTMQDVDALKNRVYETIQQELLAHFPDNEYLKAVAVDV